MDWIPNYKLCCADSRRKSSIGLFSEDESVAFIRNITKLKVSRKR